jgi:hypothetical protein
MELPCRIRKNGENHYISIPKNIIDAYNLKENDLVVIDAIIKKNIEEK